MKPDISGATIIAGVAGSPVRHSLSPLIHNAWLAEAGLDGVYLAFPLARDGLKALVDGFRGGVIAGLNIAGLLAAFAEQAPKFDVAASPVVILGAGGASRGAAAALLDAGVPEVRLINRTRERAEAIRSALGDQVTVFEWGELREALIGAGAVVNATSLGLDGREPLAISLEGLQAGGVVMDMVYKPLRTAFLARAAAEGFVTVDGVAMLIGQAAPSFEAFFGQASPAGVDVRALALKALSPNAVSAPA